MKPAIVTTTDEDANKQQTNEMATGTIAAV